MAEYVELYIDQGTDFSTTINIEDDTTNLSQNIYGYVVTSSLKRSTLSSNAVANFQCSVDSNTNYIILTMTSANTANIKAGRYFYDVRVKDTQSGNAVSRLIEGVVIVSPSITG